MKRQLGILIVVAGCSGGNKGPAEPMPVNDPVASEPAIPDEPVAPTEVAKPMPPPPPDTGGYKIVKPEELTYAPLNPEGPGPEVAVVHGDLESGGAFFLKIPPGGKAGVHTHTADYHAVVISGAPRHWLAGTDKKAKPLAAGSYWFQPGSQPHGDDCTGKEPCVLFIMMPSKFDFAPTPKAKKPAVGKYTLTARKAAKFAPFDPEQPEGMKLAVVHGDPATGPVGFLIEVPAGGNSGLHSHTSDYHAVVLDGAPAHWLPHEANEGEPVGAGTYWFQPGGYDHGDRCTSDTACHAFVFMDKAMDFKPAAQPAAKSAAAPAAK
jgi:quercetin dioxygenase-like cupin family protein